MSEQVHTGNGELLHFTSIVNATIRPEDEPVARQTAVVYGNAIGTLAMSPITNVLNNEKLTITLEPSPDASDTILRQHERFILDRIRDERMRKYELTPLMREITDLLAKGYDNRRIADELKMAKSTIRDYMGKIMDTIGCRTRAEIVPILYLGHIPTLSKSKASDYTSYHD